MISVVIPLELMQFELRHMMIVVAVISVTLALCSFGLHGVTLSVPFTLIAAGIGLAYLNRTEGRCPEYLKLRYHGSVVVILFIATQWLMPYFFAYGFWIPPINLFFTIISIPLISALQISKWHDTKLAHIGSRVTQILYLWGLFVMRILVITIGDYIGP